MTVAAGKDSCHCGWMAADNRHIPTAPPVITVPRPRNPAESGLDRILILKNTEAALVFRLNGRADWNEKGWDVARRSASLLLFCSLSE